MTFDQKRFDKLVQDKEAWFKGLKPLYCPLLTNYVNFNAKGFHHLFYDGTGKGRTNMERIYRLNLLPLCIPVIKVANTIVEYRKQFIKSLGKEVEFWRIGEKVGKKKTFTTVILRRIGKGPIHFWSIWKKRTKKAASRRLP